MTTKVFARLLAASLTLAPPAMMMMMTACSGRQQSGSREITVAAASNLTDAFEELSKQFTERTGTRVVLSFGATADLAKQIENGAPFDLFASADPEHIDHLIRQNLILADTRSSYARGRLVVWAPPGSRVTPNKLEDLTDAAVTFIAIAKPDVAPYGRASVEALKARNLWAALEQKVVYAQNVSQTKQYALAGSAEVAFLPLALVKPGEGNYFEVDAKLHRPIDQVMGMVSASKKQEDTRRFTEFIMSKDGQSLLERFGYAVSR